jgi:hypothetical protein
MSQQKNNTVLIILVVAGIVVCLCGSVGIGGWSLFQRFTAKIPAHTGFGDAVSKQSSAGWWTTTIPEVHLSIDAPCEFKPNLRTIFQRRARWVESYISYHGSSPAGSIAIGALWLDPHDRHFSAESCAEDAVALLRESPANSNLHATKTPLTVSGHRAYVVRSNYHRDRDLFQLGLYVENGDNDLYIIQTCSAGKVADADKQWARMLASIKLQ